MNLRRDRNLGNPLRNKKINGYYLIGIVSANPVTLAN